ncbi:MAG TPA: lytic transglycosylase domain-containing protein [Longimicrobiales bacterium]|nr:lytic transglycosylase domain-containing protein [Longimicrobiales bacterium]
MHDLIASGYDPRRPGGWGLAFDAAVPEGDEWRGPERRHQPSLPEPPLAERRGNLLARTRQLATKFREPLIGLGLAGVSMPLLKTIHGPAAAPPAKEAVPAAAPAAAPTPPRRDVEAEAASRWANAERYQTVQAAMNRYGIGEDLASDIFDHAKQQGVDPKLAYGLVKTESAFKNEAVSNVGARGLTQLMPRTAGWLEPGTSTRDLYNRETNLRLGFRYLRQLLDKYHGDRRLALLAYNRGPGIVDRLVRQGRNPNNGYADRVLGDRLR